MIRSNIFIWVIGLLMLVSCGQNATYQSIAEMEDQAWKADTNLPFEFEIVEEGAYNIYYIVKNKTTYPYYNLYVKANFRNESDLIADNLQEVILFHKKTGRPYGKGLGGLMEHQFMAFPKVSLKPGKHTLSLEQYMRVAELKDVVAIGIKVEKAE